MISELTVDEAREATAGVAEAAQDASRRYAQALLDAEAVGRDGVLARVATIRAHGKSDADVLFWLLEELARGADDTWSGRGNDFARAVFDGKRRAVEMMVGDIRYGS